MDPLLIIKPKIENKALNYPIKAHQIKILDQIIFTAD
jgi:hypothetical protein